MDMNKCCNFFSSRAVLKEKTNKTGVDIPVICNVFRFGRQCASIDLDLTNSLLVILKLKLCLDESPEVPCFEMRRTRIDRMEAKIIGLVAINPACMFDILHGPFETLSGILHVIPRSINIDDDITPFRQAQPPLVLFCFFFFSLFLSIFGLVQILDGLHLFIISLLRHLSFLFTFILLCRANLAVHNVIRKCYLG